MQIKITKNKEHVIDETLYKYNLNVSIYSSLSTPIYPQKYGDFEAFYDAVCAEWFTQWNYVYDTI